MRGLPEIALCISATVKAKNFKTYPSDSIQEIKTRHF